MGVIDSNSNYICCAKVCVKKHLYAKRQLLVLSGPRRGAFGSRHHRCRLKSDYKYVGVKWFY